MGSCSILLFRLSTHQSLQLVLIKQPNYSSKEATRLPDRCLFFFFCFIKFAKLTKISVIKIRLVLIKRTLKKKVLKLRGEGYTIDTAAGGGAEWELNCQILNYIFVKRFNFENILLKIVLLIIEKINSKLNERV